MSQMAAAEHQKQAQTPIASAKGELRRKCGKCRDKKKNLQRSAFASAPETVSPRLHEALSSQEALDAATRAFAGPSLGRDFSQIPVHPSGVQANYPNPFYR